MKLSGSRIEGQEPLSKGERTAERILEAACECIARIGIEKTSITAIAGRAGVSRGLVAHYFPVKSRMFREVISYVASRGLASIESAVAGKTGRDGALAVIEANLDFFLGNPHYFKCFFLFYYFAAIDPGYRKLNTELTRVAVDRFRKLLGPGSSDLAQSLHDELIGAIQKFYVVEGPREVASYSREAIRQARARLGMALH